MNDFKTLKQIVEDITLSEAKSMQIMRSFLVKENEKLHNLVVDKIISILGKWSTTPPIEILKELEEFSSEI